MNRREFMQSVGAVGIAPFIPTLSPLTYKELNALWWQAWYLPEKSAERLELQSIMKHRWYEHASQPWKLEKA